MKKHYKLDFPVQISVRKIAISDPVLQSGYFFSREILHHYVGYNLSEHQIITIIRAFQDKDYLNPSLPTENLYSILQTELKRINFMFFDQLVSCMRVLSKRGRL